MEWVRQVLADGQRSHGSVRPQANAEWPGRRFGSLFHHAFCRVRLRQGGDGLPARRGATGSPLRTCQDWSRSPDCTRLSEKNVFRAISKKSGRWAVKVFTMALEWSNSVGQVHFVAGPAMRLKRAVRTWQRRWTASRREGCRKLFRPEQFTRQRE